MGKLIGLLLLVVGIWVGMEVYTNGTQGAFGGALARFGHDDGAVQDTRSVPQRAGDAARRARDLDAQRLDHAMTE
jgi:uncharacterized membrane protein